MKVLMFGWEFPPHISGGLGTACFGITKALAAYPNIDLTFVVPKAWGDEPECKMKLIGANEIDLIESKIKTERFEPAFTCLSIQSGMMPYIDPDDYKEVIVHLNEFKESSKSFSLESVKFTGNYNADLMTEIHNFSVVAEHIAKKGQYDIIHAHDWLTFPSGILAKKATGAPLIIHVHATDFDRSGGDANPDVYKIEKLGMDMADRIITVSNHTSRIVVEKYGIDRDKIFTVHNGVEPFKQTVSEKRFNKKKIVTFLGRITVQKGPDFFVEVARKVSSHLNNVEFVMAGSGDMMNKMIELVRKYKLTDRFHFPGFLKGDQVTHLFNNSDVFIMPSVSEPFGICPLEAIFCRVPVIISKQSGVSEVIQNAIKLDYWDTDAMSDAVYGILNRPVLRKVLVRKAIKEARTICWEKSASKIVDIYKQFVRA